MGGRLGGFGGGRLLGHRTRRAGPSASGYGSGRGRQWPWTAVAEDGSGPVHGVSAGAPGRCALRVGASYERGGPGSPGSGTGSGPGGFGIGDGGGSGVGTGPGPGCGRSGPGSGWGRSGPGPGGTGSGPGGVGPGAGGVGSGSGGAGPGSGGAGSGPGAGPGSGVGSGPGVGPGPGGGPGCAGSGNGCVIVSSSQSYVGLDLSPGYPAAVRALPPSRDGPGPDRTTSDPRGRSGHTGRRRRPPVSRANRSEGRVNRPEDHVPPRWPQRRVRAPGWTGRGRWSRSGGGPGPWTPGRGRSRRRR